MHKLTHDTKYTKDQVYKKLLAMKKTGETLSEFELDAFILHFAPPVPKTPKTAFEWVAKAVASDKDIRTYLRYVYVQDKIAVGTDGYRLHFANVDLADGYYDAKTGLPVGDKGYFPDWRRIIPKKQELHAASTWELMASSAEKKPEFIVFVGGYSFYKKYLDEALATQENCSVTDSGLLTKITGENQFGTFVLACRRD